MIESGITVGSVKRERERERNEFVQIQNLEKWEVTRGKNLDYER